MIKAWLGLWRQAADYRSKTTVKTYWLAIVFHILVMFVGVVPYTFLMMLFTKSVAVIAGSYMVLIHLPVLAMYVRRANDAGWKPLTTLYAAVVAPVISGVVVGLLPSNTVTDREHGIVFKLFALVYGSAFYGSVLGLVLYGDVTALGWIYSVGLLLGAVVLIVYGVRHFREVLLFFGWNGD